MSQRLAQISGHLSNTYGRGLLAGEVAIITGAGQVSHRESNIGNAICQSPAYRELVVVQP